MQIVIHEEFRNKGNLNTVKVCPEIIYTLWNVYNCVSNVYHTSHKYVLLLLIEVNLSSNNQTLIIIILIY